MPNPIHVEPKDTNWDEIRSAYASSTADTNHWHAEHYDTDLDQKRADADRWLQEHDAASTAEIKRLNRALGSIMDEAGDFRDSIDTHVTSEDYYKAFERLQKIAADALNGETEQ